MLQEVVDQIKTLIRGETQEIHTALPAKVESVNTDGTVNARPYGAYKLADGTTMDYPLISGIPVFLFKSGSVSVTFPIAVGDGCLLVFCEKELDSWLEGQLSGMSLNHSLSSAIAIPGLGTPTAADTQAGGTIIVKNGSTELKVASGGVAISGSLTVTGNITAGGTISPNPKDE